MTPYELLNKFLAVCPIQANDYRPFGENSIIVWTDKGREKAIRVTYVDDDRFSVSKTSTQEWESKMGII